MLAGIVAWPTVARPPTRLEQCLLLALLMHGLLVAWLGSAPGSARPGEGVWGRINVSLRGEPGPAREGSESVAAPRPSSGEAAPHGDRDNSAPIAKAKNAKIATTTASSIRRAATPRWTPGCYTPPASGANNA